MTSPGREVKSISGNQLEGKVPSVPVPETAPEPHGPHHLPQCSQTASPAHHIQQTHTNYPYHDDHRHHPCDNSPSPLISCLMFPSSNFHFLINKNKNDLCPSSASGVAGRNPGTRWRGRAVSQVHLGRKVPEGPKMLLLKAKCSVSKSYCSNLCLHLI